MKKQEIYNKLTALLSNKSEIEFASVFGSFPESENYHDIDVAVYLKKNFKINNFKEYPFGYESSLISEIITILGTDKIDLVVMNKAGILLQQRIINKGRLLFDRDKFERIKYENSLLSR